MGSASTQFRVNCMARVFLAVLAAAVFLAGCRSEPEAEPPAEPPAETPGYDGTIVAMGDSLTAGLGVSPADSYPAVLERLLRERGFNYRVINGGVSGETSSGARARLEWILAMEPDMVIVETGANDGLRGIDPDLTRRNIEEIIATLLAEDVIVVLAGMRMSANLGASYVAAFDGIYPDLAAAYPVTFMPFFLEGVALQAELNQADSIHPNEAGYRVIAGNVLGYVIDALEGS